MTLDLNTGKFVPSSQIVDVHIIALTATATPKVQVDIQKNLEMVNANVFNRHSTGITSIMK